ncbi:MAG TPA: MFS transporter [Pseudonocardiaceae bacterium]|jgi:UMF1 family MFS transporter|nr:MFS transporter [Pseudonocardiaceae bacterium]
MVRRTTKDNAKGSTASGGTEGAAADAALRRQRRAWYTYGWGAHTFETSVVTVFMSRYLVAVAQNAVGKDGTLRVLGIPIAAGSLFAYVVSFTAIVLIFLMPVVGAIADRTGRKRELMLGLGYLGAFSVMAMWFVKGSDWQLGTFLMIFAYLTYTCAKVVFNSFLPSLAAADERDKISSIGWAAGYIGGGIVLAGSFVASFVITDSALLARVSLLAAGLWWALFALVPLRRLRNPESQVELAPRTGSVLTAGFRQLGHTIKGARLLPMTLLFLVAYLVYYDGINTVTTLSATYGSDELGLSDNTLLTAILIVQFAAFGGALLLGRFADRWGAKRVIAWSLVVWIGIVVAAYYLTKGSAVQFYVLAMALSVVMGGTQALSRSLYSSMIPVGAEAEYFSLYEISSSGSSALGPLLFGLAYQNTGSYRVAILSLVVFFVVGLGLLIPVNVRRAVTTAGNQVPESLLAAQREKSPV